MPSRSLVSVVDRVLEWLLVGLMGLSVLNVLWQVFTRFVLDAPSALTEELARYLLIWIGVLGAAYAAGKRVHLALDLLPEKLQGRGRLKLNLVIEALVMAFALAVMVIGGARLVYIQYALGQASSSLGLPMALVYAVVPLSGLLILFYSAVHLAEQLAQLRALRTAPAEELEVEEPGADKEEIAPDLHIN